MEAAIQYHVMEGQFSPDDGAIAWYCPTCGKLILDGKTVERGDPSALHRGSLAPPGLGLRIQPPELG